MNEQELYNRVRSYLPATEKVLWIGRPGMGHLFKPLDLILVPFSFVWARWGVIGILPGFQTVPNDLRPIIYPVLLLFVAVGIYLTVGRFLLTIILRRNTFYAVTDRRICRWRFGDLHAIARRSARYLVIPYKDGRGTVYFSTEDRRAASAEFDIPAGFEFGAFTLDNVPEISEVERILSESHVEVTEEWEDRPAEERGSGKRTMNDQEFAAYVRSKLDASEHLLWAGRPGMGHFFEPFDIFFIPFSCAWAGMAFFVFYHAFWTAGIEIKLILLLFAAVGFYISIGRFLWKILLRRNTVYAVTEHRVHRWRFGRQRTISIGSAPMHLKLYRDGSGTISFEFTDYASRPGLPASDRGGWTFRLENIPDASRVYRMMNEQLYR